MTIACPTGVFDILPIDPKEKWRETHLWQFLESLLREHALAYGCREIRTPMFERTELFVRSVGDTTDIVSKEMYTFEDRGKRSMSLKPEGTAPVMRAFIEKQLQNVSSAHRFFYITPLFRYERPQAGRFRQHHQFGVEVIGNPHPEQDAELIEMIYSLFERLGLQNLKVYINSLGDKAARANFREALKAFLTPKLSKMSQESQKRFETNPLRILDSKDPLDMEVVKNAPSILDFIDADAERQFAKVRQILDHLKIPYEVNSRLVRGLDYYNNMVFEVTSGLLGAQNSVAGGGRYDGLLKELGGPELPSVGFGMGIERLIQSLLQQHLPIPDAPRPEIALIALGEEALLRAFELARILRKQGTRCHLDLSGKKLKNAMQQVDNLGVEFVLILGDNEIKEGKVQLKVMATGDQIPLAIESVPFFFKMRNFSGALKNDCVQMEGALRSFCIQLASMHTHPSIDESLAQMSLSAASLLNALPKR